MKAEFGKIDVLFLNAATIGHVGSSLEVSDQLFDQTINTNLKSLLFMIKESLPLMREGSNILLTSSLRAFDPASDVGLYAITKTAVNSLVKVLAEELKPRKVRINSIAPGLVDTDLAAGLIESNPQKYR